MWPRSILAFVLAAPPIAAQQVDFDIDVARIGMGGRFEPFVVESLEPLADALRDGKVQKDTRLPTMDIGLGVWTESEARYYPMETVQDNGGLLIDDFDGRRLLVYVERPFGVLAAIFTESATAEAEGSEVRLEGGLTLRGGVLTDAEGARIESPPPMQMFTRWYGFALTFPETIIFGAGGGS